MTNFCAVAENINNSTDDHYLDNFIIYNENISKLDSEELIYEICVVLLGMICKFFALYFIILIIKLLTPVYIIFDSSIFYFIIKIIAIFYFKININYFLDENGNFDKIQFWKFFLDILGNFIAIFNIS